MLLSVGFLALTCVMCCHCCNCNERNINEIVPFIALQLWVNFSIMMVSLTYYIAVDDSVPWFVILPIFHIFGCVIFLIYENSSEFEINTLQNSFPC